MIKHKKFFFYGQVLRKDLFLRVIQIIMNAEKWVLTQRQNNQIYNNNKA